MRYEAARMENQNNWIYFKRDKDYERQLLALDKSGLSKRNKKLIAQYINHLVNKGDRIGTLSKILILLRRYALRQQKDLDQLTKADILSYISHLTMDPNLSDASKSSYRKAIKQFFKWFMRDDSRLEDIDPDLSKTERTERAQRKKEAKAFYEYILEDVKGGYRLKEIDATEIITDADIEVLILKGCQCSKEQAFVALLHETGARIGEFLNLQRKHIKYQNEMAEVALDGKTGKRIVFAYKSLPYLVRYMEDHMDRENPDSYMWLCSDNVRKGQPVKHIGALRLLRRVFDKAGLKKKCNPHWFRHSRASILAPQVTEPILRRYMGWSKGSNMIKHYGHFCVDDVRNAILASNGLQKAEDRQPKVIKCPICTAMNPSGQQYCYRCCRPLNITTVLQDQELINSQIAITVRKMLEVFKDPAQLAAFEEYKKTQGGA